MEKKIKIDGMSCQKCENHVEEALKELKNVESVSVDFESGYANLISSQEISSQDIENALLDFGYRVLEIKNISN